jgi:hypothetical protein
VAYESPVLAEPRATRRQNKAALHLRWSAVEGADGYQVQISKTLTFQRPVVETRARKPQWRVRLQPGIYFWRARAVGEAGEGAWSSAQVLDATPSEGQSRHKPVARARSGLQKAELSASEGLATSAAAKLPAEPLEVVWKAPAHRSIVTESPITVAGAATRGSTVQVNSYHPQRVTSTFSFSLPLTHGRNDIVLTSRFGAAQKTLRRVVYYADPSRLAPIRARFEALRNQLDEIGTIRTELVKTARSLESRLDTASDQRVVAEIKIEMQRITHIRRQIDREINKAISDLDGLLGG